MAVNHTVALYIQYNDHLLIKHQQMDRAAIWRKYEYHLPYVTYDEHYPIEQAANQFLRSINGEAKLNGLVCIFEKEVQKKGFFFRKQTRHIEYLFNTRIRQEFETPSGGYQWIPIDEVQQYIQDEDVMSVVVRNQVIASTVPILEVK